MKTILVRIMVSGFANNFFYNYEEVDADNNKIYFGKMELGLIEGTKSINRHKWI